MRETGNTVRQALALLNPRLRGRWLLPLSWSVEMMATAAMLVLIRLISDPAGADPLRTFKGASATVRL
jgi:hypothetical protein